MWLISRTDRAGCFYNKIKNKSNMVVARDGLNMSQQKNYQRMINPKTLSPLNNSLGVAETIQHEISF